MIKEEDNLVCSYEHYKSRCKKIDDILDRIKDLELLINKPGDEKKIEDEKEKERLLIELKGHKFVYICSLNPTNQKDLYHFKNS